jgi:hypothetical protein
MSTIANNLDPPNLNIDTDLSTDPSTDNDDNFDESDLKAFIEAYLSMVPEPTDDQMHELANLLGFEYSWFERLVFSLFSDKIEDIKELADDPLDLLLLSFFLLNPEPDEDQIHYLSILINKTPEEIEERIYSLLAQAGEEDTEDTEDTDTN